MIAQIDPKTRSARYFDIRKLTPVENYRLMGVPERFIQRLMATRVETYQAISGMDDELALLGLTDSAKPRDINEAADEAIRQLENNLNEETDNEETDARADLQSDRNEYKDLQSENDKRQRI